MLSIYAWAGKKSRKIFCSAVSISLDNACAGKYIISRIAERKKPLNRVNGSGAADTPTTREGR